MLVLILISHLFPRFKHTSVFERASHVLGVVDFLVLKTLAHDWREEMDKSWTKVTEDELNEVKPQVGSRKVSKDATSPSKMTNDFIVLH